MEILKPVRITLQTLALSQQTIQKEELNQLGEGELPGQIVCMESWHVCHVMQCGYPQWICPGLIKDILQKAAQIQRKEEQDPGNEENIFSVFVNNVYSFEYENSVG